MPKPSLENTRLLERFAAADALCVNDLLDIYDPDEARTRVGDLVRLGYIEQTEIYWNTFVTTEISDAISYRITVAGRDFLEARQQEIQRRADEDAEKEWNRLQSEATKTKDRWFSLLSAIIGAIFGSIVTFLLDHHAEVWALIKRLFGL